MRTKVIKTSTMEYWFYRVMKKNKAMIQEIRKIWILYTNASKEFYHHIKFRKSIMNYVSIMCNEYNQVFCKKTLKKFAVFTGKHLYCGLFFFDKYAGLQACFFIKKTLQHRCFLGSSANFLRITILKNICERLLLRVFPFMLVWTFSCMNK